MYYCGITIHVDERVEVGGWEPAGIRSAAARILFDYCTTREIGGRRQESYDEIKKSRVLSIPTIDLGSLACWLGTYGCRTLRATSVLHKPVQAHL